MMQRMRALWFILVFALWSESAIAESEADYSFDIEFLPSCDSLLVDVTIGLDPELLRDSTILLFTQKAVIESVLILEHTVVPAKWQRGSADTLLIVADSVARMLNRSYITFKYTLPCDTLSSGDIVLRREGRWYPILPDIPFRSRVVFKAPERYSVFSAGREEASVCQDGSVAGAWQTAEPILSLPLVFMSARTGKMFSSDDSGISVSYYAHSADDSTAQAILNQCARSARYYESILGPCPFDEISIIEFPDYDFGQSLPGMIIVGGVLIKYFWQPGIGHWPAHEMAHQWVGNTVLTNTLSMPPGRIFVEESFAEYLRIEFVADTFGEDSAMAILDSFQAEVELLADAASKEPLYKATHSSPSLRTIAYNQGPLVWDKLHWSLGDDKWHNLLQTIFHRYRQRLFGYDELRTALLVVSDAETVTYLDTLVGYTGSQPAPADTTD